MSTDPSSARSPESGDSDRFVFQAGEDRPWSEAIVEAVATHAGHEDPIAVADEFEPLYDAVDPSALNALFASTDATDRAARPGAVTFTYADRRITVETSGRIELVSLES